MLWVSSKEFSLKELELLKRGLTNTITQLKGYILKKIHLNLKIKQERSSLFWLLGPP